MDTPPRRIRTAPSSGSQDQLVRLDSRDLCRDADRVQIEHRGETYRLQVTRLGKLILTK